MITDRDRAILLFMSQTRLATTKQIQRVFFNNLHHSIVYNRLTHLVDCKLLKRKYFNLEGKKNIYIYYLDKFPAKKTIKHDLKITEFYVKLIENNYIIIVFEKNHILVDIIKDDEIWVEKNNKEFGIFLEIQLANHCCQKKYYNLKSKVNKKIPDTLYIISDKDITIQKLRNFKTILDNLEMENINLLEGENNGRKE